MSPTGIEPDPAYTSPRPGFGLGRALGGLPNTISELITPFGMNLLRDPSGGLAAALRGTDRGVRGPAVNLGTPDYQGSRHLGANVAATARIVRWFLRLTSVPAQDGAQGV